MNNNEKNKFEKFIREKQSKQDLLLNLKTGENRGIYAKESNYCEISSHVSIFNSMLMTKTNAADVVKDAANIIKKVITREVEVQKPNFQENLTSRNELTVLINSSSKETNCDDGIMISDVSVRLDNDQLKHQHPSNPIGTRKVSGGNKFVQKCDVTWHQNNTMEYMAKWANGLINMKEGEKLYHGQSISVDDIHYEGYCLMSAGKKYVLFHCYPADNSELRMSGNTSKKNKEKTPCLENNQSDNNYRFRK